MKLKTGRQKEGGYMRRDEMEGKEMGQGERKAKIYLAVYNSPYDSAIPSPTYMCFHLIHPAKQVQHAYGYRGTSRA